MGDRDWDRLHKSGAEGGSGIHCPIRAYSLTRDGALAFCEGDVASYKALHNECQLLTKLTRVAKYT